MVKRVVLLVVFFSLAATTLAYGIGSPTSGPEDGLRQFKRMPQTNLSNAVQLDREGAAALDAGEYAIAEYDERAALNLNPGVVTARPVLAWALVADGKANEALPVYRWLYAGGEWHPNVMLPYALLLLKNGEWAAAVGAYNRALPFVGSPSIPNGNRLLSEDSGYTAGDPQPQDLETDIHVAMGMANVNRGSWIGRSDPDANLAEFKKALALEADSPLANLAHAAGLREIGRYADAMAAFQNVANKYSGDIKAAALSQINDPVLRWKATSVAK
jgi:tetratricopeptide (TPR) repeat protein